jgi:PII-like signaling protein
METNQIKDRMLEEKKMEMPHEAVLLRIFTSADDRCGVEEPLYQAIVMKAREMHLAGATVLKGTLGFGQSGRIRKAHLIGTDERPVVIEICDDEEKINAFLPVLDEMMESGFVTLEKARVLQYGRERAGYLARLKENVWDRLHFYPRIRRAEDADISQQSQS